ncbi:MAG: hypothetical protein IPJ81_00995 [Chitinophagaceae bacterium]|nr:hypothetical protein [Chitinophagaceae bacterium]
MGSAGFPLWIRIALGIAVVLFLWWRISRKWDKASAYSDSMASEEEEQKKWYEQSKADARVQQFKKDIINQYSIVEGTEASGENYIIKYIVFYNNGQSVAPNDSNAQFISFYMQGKDHLIVSKNLSTGEVSEAKINKMSFNLSLPEWVKRKW